jgi:hypothetical protein
MTAAIIGAVLFVLLTPGLLLRIPSKGSLLTASVVHAVVFGIVFYLIFKIIYPNSSQNRYESFSRRDTDDETVHDNIAMSQDPRLSKKTNVGQGIQAG